jgi:hypothetical protein
MDFNSRPAFNAAGATVGAVAMMAAVYAGLPLLAVIGGVGLVANVIAAGITHSPGDVHAHTNAAVRTHPFPNDGGPITVSNPAELKPGERMPDGTIYAGLSPDTQKPIYVTPSDAPLTYTFNEARKYADKFDANGHHDWRVPSKGELNVLFQNRAAIGGFNNGYGYWSSMIVAGIPQRDMAVAQRFRDGDGHYYNEWKHLDASLRCVRG